MQKFEAVAEGVGGVETADAGQAVIGGDGDAGRLERGAGGFEVGGAEAGVGFAGGLKLLLDAQVEEDAATACRW